MTHSVYTSHKHYEAARRAHMGTSFSPDKRAESECGFFDEICAEFRAAGKEWAIEKFEALFLKNLSAKARCMSSMITGPARFPVARMEKYNRWQHTASEALCAFIDKVRRPPVEPRHELDYGIPEKEYMIGDVKVIQNVKDNRLQLIFPGKPESVMIDTLKSRVFKWSPRNGAWQRQLTHNAISVLGYIFPQQAL